MKKQLFALFAGFSLLATSYKTLAQPVFPSIASNPAIPVFNANDVTYLNADTAVAVGNTGMTWRSTDGGLNWSVIPTFTSTTNNNSVIMMGKYICIAGDLGTVTFSNDKGLTWANSAQAQPLINYRGVHFADTSFGAAVGDNGDALIYHWVGGLGWAHIPSSQTDTFNAVASYKTSASVFVDGFAMAVGNNGAVSTYAFGSWSNLTPPTTRDLNGIYLFPTNDTLIAVGDSGLILRSPNYGANWTTINSVGKNLYDIAPGLLPNQFIAVGDSGTIFVSFDRGNTFIEHTAGFNTSNLRGVSAKDPRGSFAGSGSTLRVFAADTVDIIHVTDSVLCPGDNFKVAVELKGLYGSTNVASLELSDATGSFVTPVVIGTKPGPLQPVDTISATIPGNAAASGLYMIRATTSDPSVTSDVSPITLTVLQKPNSVTVTANFTDLYVNSQPGCTYQWYFNGSPMGGATDTIVTTIGNGNYHVVVTGSNGCTTTSNTFVYTATSIKNVFAVKFAVSPNPASNSLHIQVPDAMNGKTLQIFNALGKKVLSEKVKTGSNHLACSELEPGLYFLQLEAHTAKVVIVR